MEALALAFALAFVAIEHQHARRHGRAIYTSASLATDLACHALNLTVQFGIGLTLFAGYPILVEHLAIAPLQLDAPLHWVAGFLAFDFMMWLRHLAAHRIQLLWLFHGVHHESRQLNLGTAMRVSAFQALQFLPFTPLIALAGVPLEMGVVLFSATALWTFAHHTRLVDRLGPLESILVTPRHHRTHHALAEEGANYGAVLLLWDRLAGTFTDRTTEHFGTPELAAEVGALEANLAPLRALGARMSATRGTASRLALLFDSPHQPGATAPEAGARRVSPSLLVVAIATAHLPLLLPSHHTTAAQLIAMLAAVLAIFAVRGRYERVSA